MAAVRSLADYRRKRHFGKTPEPQGGKSKGKRIFVIQKHDATRLHYDFRLEHKGVLLSWAVPKEPSTDPKVKRLAVHVEDHPLDYATFEGVIPEGNYGAGTVEIWDSGTWEPVQPDVDRAMADGELKVDLHGERLQGRWVLVRMGEPSDKENWLLIKERDHGRSEPIEQVAWNDKTKLSHELCTLRADLPDGNEWRYEVKWDGYRVFAAIQNGNVEFITRNDNKISLPKLAKAITESVDADCILDGELVVLDQTGRSDFGQLKDSISKDTANIRFVAFDLVKLNALDLRKQPLAKRIALLERLISHKTGTRVMTSPRIDGDAKSVLASACELGLEGIVAKNEKSAYAGRRTTDWIKVKCRRKSRFTVVGYMLLTGSARAMGALILAEKSGKDYSFIGRVGTGFSEADRLAWKTRLENIERPAPVVEGMTRAERNGVHWVKPEFEVDVEYAEITNSGRLRQASLISSENRKPETREARKPMRQSNAHAAVKLSHPERVLDPKSRLTKKDAFDFYEEFGDLIMPYLEERFVSMVRSPDGIEEPVSFQKHMMKGNYRGMTEKSDSIEDMFVEITSPVGLLEAAQMGVLEFHPWGSRISQIEKPDVLIFDLDPSEDVKWKQVLEAAGIVRRRMQDIGLDPFMKLSGGKGVHLVLSIVPELEWPEVKSFCRSIAEALSAEQPKLFLSNMSKEKRKGKVFIDYLRNGRGATAAAPYSLRARAGLPVAMPVTWEELVASKSGGDFDLVGAREYLRSRRSDPWRDFFKRPVSLVSLLGKKKGAE